MTVYRCDWCGRFYSSPLPEATACPNHIPEHNVRFAVQIARFNERQAERQAALTAPSPATSATGAGLDYGR